MRHYEAVLAVLFINFQITLTAALFGVFNAVRCVAVVANVTATNMVRVHLDVVRCWFPVLPAKLDLFGCVVSQRGWHHHVLAHAARALGARGNVCWRRGVVVHRRRTNITGFESRRVDGLRRIYAVGRRCIRITVFNDRGLRVTTIQGGSSGIVREEFTSLACAQSRRLVGCPWPFVFPRATVPLPHTRAFGAVAGLARVRE